MTSETRITISLGDIKAVEVECVKCHTRTVRLVESWSNPSMGCGECGESWIMPHSQDYENLKRFLELLGIYAKLSEEKMPYRMRLEITGESRPKQ